VWIVMEARYSPTADTCATPRQAARCDLSWVAARVFPVKSWPMPLGSMNASQNGSKARSKRKDWWNGLPSLASSMWGVPS
jgi:hypothetical protein